jgi:hypothetical protein
MAIESLGKLMLGSDPNATTPPTTASNPNVTGDSAGGGVSAQDGIGQVQNQANIDMKKGGHIDLKNCKVTTHQKHKGAKDW